jgi:spheroidene monooxygenase
MAPRYLCPVWFTTLAFKKINLEFCAKCLCFIAILCKFKFTVAIGRVAIETVSISFFRFSSPVARLWAFAQMGAARLTLPKTPHIRFWKLLGSGTGEGFTPIPNTGVYAILATWPSLDAAKAQTTHSATYRKYIAKSAEHWTIHMAASSARGKWSATEPFQISGTGDEGALAALTRATIKPKVALKFWQRVPAISKVIGDDPNVVFKAGVGEVPWFHQVTFSIWPDTSAMANFARKDGPHARAIQAVRAGDWFSEELYARFNILESAGSWGGQNPLANLTTQEVAS